MSYYTSFKLKGELDKQFLPLYSQHSSTDYIEKYKNVLFAICMEDMRNKKPEDYFKLYETLSIYTKMFLNILLTEYYLYIQDTLKSEDNTISFCGWQYSRSSLSTLYTDKEDMIAHQVSYLFKIAIIKCGDYWAKDSTYHDKYSEVIEAIDSIVETANDFASASLVEFYREHPELAEEKGDDTLEDNNLEEESND